MRKLLLLTALALATAVAALGAEAVRNADFSAAGDRPALAAAWELPAGGAWQRSGSAGPQGRACLVFTATRPAGGCVRQRADFLTPGATYVLRVVSRSDGRLQPAVRLWDPGQNKEVLPLVVLAAGKEWEARSLEFRPPSADLTVELYPDAGVVGGRKVTGEAAFASLQITPQGEARRRQVVPHLGENLALTRPYTLAPNPNYSLCADAGDAVQLTDGVYTEGHFWTRPSTVGWSGSAPRLINIDLGHDLPIKGVSFSTAAGVAQVRWPAHLYLFVSPDGTLWHRVGDLVALAAAHDPLPLYGEYTNHRFWTDQLRTHARYVQVVAVSDDYTFVDEIEVIRGDDSLMAASYPDAGIGDVQAYMAETVCDELIRQQLRRDLAAVAEDLAALPEAARATPAARLAALGKQIEDLAHVPMAGFRVVLPMLPLERELFALQATVWRLQGKPALRLWAARRWDPLLPSAEPPDGSATPALAVDMMVGEYRAAALNLTNAGAEPLRLTVRLVGLPGGNNPSYVSVHSVEHVGTRWCDSVAAALPLAPAVPGGYSVEVQPGMTRQVWLTVHSTGLQAGTYAGRLELGGAGPLRTVPLSLKVYPLRFPARTTLCLGGWDYTNNEASYAIQPGNYRATVAYLQEHFVNMPWAGSGALPRGAFDAEGNMTPPDTANFDNWIRVWPQAHLYAVFVPSQDNLEGEKMGTERFNKMVGSWIRFWVGHLRQRGLKPNQLALLVYDEPNSKPQYDLIAAWGRAIKAAAPEVLLFEDPQPQDANDPREMLGLVDIIAPYRSQYLTNPGGWLQGLYEDARKQGKSLWFYNADGPTRSFDPYSYYLVQEWHVFANGGGGSCFWAFSDGGGVSCWNEYPAKGKGPYTPFYLDDSGVTTAKYMEAVREGVEDFEYLTMLQRRVTELAKQGAPAARLAAARKLLVDGPRRVLAEDVTRCYTWDQPKNRAVQDAVRVEVLRMLVELAKVK